MIRIVNAPFRFLARSIGTKPHRVNCISCLNLPTSPPAIHCPHTWSPRSSKLYRLMAYLRVRIKTVRASLFCFPVMWWKILVFRSLVIQNVRKSQCNGIGKITLIGWSINAHGHSSWNLFILFFFLISQSPLMENIIVYQILLRLLEDNDPSKIHNSSIGTWPWYLYADGFNRDYFLSFR